MKGVSKCKKPIVRCGAVTYYKLKLQVTNYEIDNAADQRQLKITSGMLPKTATLQPKENGVIIYDSYDLEEQRSQDRELFDCSIWQYFP